MHYRNFSRFVIIAFMALVAFHCAGKQELVGSGMIEVEEVDISSKLAGQIIEILVDEGARVKGGDTLVILDHKEIVAHEKEARAGLTVAEQTLKEITAQKQEIAKNVTRFAEVHREGAIADRDFEEMKTRLEVVTAQENKASAAAKAARARLDLVRIQLDNATITSPVSGVVLARNFNAGEMVLPGAAIVRIGDLNIAHLKIFISETDMGRIKLGNKVQVSVDAYPGEIFWGEVIWIASKAEFTPRNIQTKDDRAQLVFAVKVKLSNEGEKLLPGMPADAKIVQDVHR